MENFIEIFTNTFDKDLILLDEPMKKHTTFKIGGNARIYLAPKTNDHIVHAIRLCKEHNIKYYVMGNGSNILFSDKGYEGVIINIGESFEEVKLLDTHMIYAKAGTLLSKISNFAMNNSLAGMEFASGIPGSLGGGIFMNAGAYGGEMRQIVHSVEVIDKDLNIKSLSNEDMKFDYRHSICQEEEIIVLSAVIKLSQGNKEEINQKMKDYNAQRRDKQPLELPSAGSTFKRPVGHFAGKLIMDSGLRGYTIGGASISQKHCGFVVNTDNATSQDVINLAEHVKNTVKEKFGVDIEPEIRFVGEK